MTYYGPDESSETIFLERTFLAGDFVSGVGYGESLHCGSQLDSIRQAQAFSWCYTHRVRSTYGIKERFENSHIFFSHTLHSFLLSRPY